MTAAICVGYDFAARRACDREAVAEPIAGCVHEHVGRRQLCIHHVMDLEEGLMNCGDCQDGTKPHRCVLVFVPERSRA